MYERFEVRAREVVTLAGTLAARKARARGEGDIPCVRVTLAEMREALNLLAPKHGYSGGFTDALSARMERLRSSEGTITVDDLREVLSGR